mgnify:CR=1 FL=1
MPAQVATEAAWAGVGSAAAAAGPIPVDGLSIGGKPGGGPGRGARSLAPLPPLPRPMMDRADDAARQQQRYGDEQPAGRIGLRVPDEDDGQLIRVTAAK